MKNTALILTGDYWHPTDTITPVIGHILPDDKWDVKMTEEPAEFLNISGSPDLLVTFKDPIENDQIPTPIWCDDNWSSKLKKSIHDDGMGFLAVHCGLTDLPIEHIITREILRAQFITHPPQCEVEFIPDFPTEVLGFTVSHNGKQPALWAHTFGKGRICGVTPGHSTENLMCGEYIKILQNAAEWCVRK